VFGRRVAIALEGRPMRLTRTLGVGALSSMPVMAFLAGRHPEFAHAQSLLAATNIGIVGLWLFFVGAKVGGAIKRLQHILFFALIALAGVNAYLYFEHPELFERLFDL
jgi:uncharacterized membrane protein YfcA